MIDFNALSALATSALNAHCPNEHADVGQNGCEHPCLIAMGALGVEDHGISPSEAFGIGFEFALKLGALLALDPLGLPNLEPLLLQHQVKVPA